MTQIYIKYNPYLVESLIQYEGQLISESSKLYSYQKERLQIWLDKLFPIIKEECNDNEFEVTFHGTLLDYEDLQQYISIHNSQGMNISSSYIETTSTNDKVKELTSLFQEMQEGPFDDLKEEHLKDNFEKALSSEFEVSVIATMSSGKSTLINALLGQEFMPSKHEACTATIVKIKDIDGVEGFTAVCQDEDKRPISEHKIVDLEMMKRFNEDDRISYIDVETDIPFIHSDQVNLVLVDTPGPNNSRNQDHHDHTYRIIRESAKPMILYVLNATQLSTDDDRFLLKSVSDAMKVGGKQSKDRFLFVINKIDEYDTEREDSVGDALENVRSYLNQFGIDNPNIYPTSAEMAKVIRMSQNGFNLTRKQQKTLDEYELFNDVPQMHLIEYASLGEAKKQQLRAKTQLARDTGDVYGEALYHTGIPGIEEAINEYLQKYAITAKLKNAVDTFRKKVEEKRMFDRLLNDIESNAMEQQRINKQMQLVETQLQEGTKAQKFKNDINKLEFDPNKQGDPTVDKIRNLRSKIDKALNERPQNDKGKVTRLEIEQFFIKFTRRVQNLQSDVITELENLFDERLQGEAEKYIKQYALYIQELLRNNTLSLGKFELESQSFILGDLPDATELIAQHKREEEEKVGETWVANENKKIYKPWTWFQKSGHYKGIYETREYVDADAAFDEFCSPIRGDFYEKIGDAEIHMKEQSKRLKQFFIGELDKLDSAIKSKVKELKELTGNNASVAKRIQEDKYKMDWLNAFIAKLDKIMEV